MGVKLRGHEYKAFLNDKEVWRAGFWFEDCSLTIDGEEPDGDIDENEIQDAAAVTVFGGVMYRGDYIGAQTIDYEKVLRKWLRDRSVEVVVLEVSKERLQANLSAIRALSGVRVVR